jgi:hypothetical protein
MRKILPPIFIVLLISACTRETIDPTPTPPDPILKRTVQTNTAGAVMRVSHYNEFGLVSFDTIFNTGTTDAGMTYANTYNSKGKRIRMENKIPVLLSTGYYWALSDFYQDDTLPTITYRYLKGNQVAKIMHLYNSSLQLIQDSTYHTPNYGTYTYLTNYEYDLSGRLASSTDLNDTRDTTSYSTYQYAPNHVEKSTLTINHDLSMRGYSQTVTQFNAAGKIMSEKKYSGQPYALGTQIDYTYDGMGSLLKKTTTPIGSIVQEERYTNNSITGKPQKMEMYAGNQLAHTVIYYYQ